MRRMPWLWPRRRIQRPEGGGVVRQILPELPHRHPWKQQSVGCIASAVDVRSSVPLASTDVAIDTCPEVSTLSMGRSASRTMDGSVGLFGGGKFELTWV